MANIQPTVDHIGDDTLTRELRNLASQVDKNETALNQEMASISEAQQEVEQKIAGFQDAIDHNTQDITTIKGNIQTIEQDITTIEQKNTEQDTAIDQNETAIQNEVTARQNAITAEQTAREDADVTAVELSYNAGAIAIQLTREEGNMSDSVTCPFIKTATLVPTSTERAFKIQFEFQDGTQYDTNEFLIPEGGGTDVSVTGVTVVDGTSPDSFQVQIQLSDGEPLKSNDYTIDFPAQVNTYPTAVNMSLSGTTLNVTIVLNNGTNVQGTANLSGLLTGYATQEWVNGQLDNFATEDALADVQEQLTNLGISSSGNQMSINGTNAPIVNSISGAVADGKLKISVNGVESADIPLPETTKIYSISGTSWNKGVVSCYNSNLCSSMPYFARSTYFGTGICCVRPGTGDGGTGSGYYYETTVGQLRQLMLTIFSDALPEGTYKIGLVTRPRTGGSIGSSMASINDEAQYRFNINITSNGDIVSNDNTAYVCSYTNQINNNMFITCDYIEKVA